MQITKMHSIKIVSVRTEMQKSAQIHKNISVWMMNFGIRISMNTLRKDEIAF